MIYILRHFNVGLLDPYIQQTDDYRVLRKIGDGSTYAAKKFLAVKINGTQAGEKIIADPSYADEAFRELGITAVPCQLDDLKLIDPNDVAISPHTGKHGAVEWWWL